MADKQKATASSLSRSPAQSCPSQELDSYEEELAWRAGSEGEADGAAGVGMAASKHMWSRT
eukprot:2295002-Pyramimonas_sp.AAC.1